jgi:hypothetical protein
MASFIEDLPRRPGSFKKFILRRTNESVSNWTELPDRCLYHFASLVTPNTKYEWFGKKTCPVPNL